MIASLINIYNWKPLRSHERIIHSTEHRVDGRQVRGFAFIRSDDGGSGPRFSAPCNSPTRVVRESHFSVIPLKYISIILGFPFLASPSATLVQQGQHPSHFLPLYHTCGCLINSALQRCFLGTVVSDVTTASVWTGRSGHSPLPIVPIEKSSETQSITHLTAKPTLSRTPLVAKLDLNWYEAVYSLYLYQLEGSTILFALEILCLVMGYWCRLCWRCYIKWVYGPN